VRVPDCHQHKIIAEDAMTITKKQPMTLSRVAMAGRLGIALVMVLGVARGAAAQDDATEAVPRIEVSATEFDFGEVWQGQPVQKEFTVKNTGTAPLELRLRRSCGCTPVSTPKSLLAPGEADSFTISYDTAKRRGRANQRVTLVTNDPLRGNVEIKITGNVKRLYTVTPADGLVFQRLMVDSRETKSVRFVSAYDGPLNLRLPPGQDFGCFDVELREIEPGREYEMTARTKPPLTEEVARIEVVLETGLADIPTVSVPVRAWVQPDFACQTQLLRAARQSIVSMTHNIGFEFRADKPVKLVEVRPSFAKIEYEILPPVPRSGQEEWLVQTLRVTLPPGNELPDGELYIDILTDSSDPRHARIRVPIEVVEPRTGGQRRQVAPSSEQP
jgi:hypothetical protein